MLQITVWPNKPAPAPKLPSILGYQYVHSWTDDIQSVPLSLNQYECTWNVLRPHLKVDVLTLMNCDIFDLLQFGQPFMCFFCDRKVAMLLL